jgi:hypothetical protein
MTVAHDVYAETNPAFCTYALAEFARAYLSISPAGPELLTAYLALPVALSGDFAVAFGGTNKNTGLLEWVERSPQLQVGLAERINSSMQMVTEALRFGCFAGTLSVAEDVRLRLGGKKLTQSAFRRLESATARAVKRAERLGYWFAMAGSTRNILDIMGLTL